MISRRCAKTGQGGAPVANGLGLAYAGRCRRSGGKRPPGKGPYLLDSSAWVEMLRPGQALRLESWLKPGEIATCLPVIKEVLQGIREEADFRKMREALFAMIVVDSPLPAAASEEAAGLYRTARRAGVTVRSSVDCLIASIAIRHDFLVLHRDRDFHGLARVSPLRERSI